MMSSLWSYWVRYFFHLLKVSMEYQGWGQYKCLTSQWNLLLFWTRVKLRSLYLWQEFATNGLWISQLRPRWPALYSTTELSRLPVRIIQTPNTEGVYLCIRSPWSRILHYQCVSKVLCKPWGFLACNSRPGRVESANESQPVHAVM